MQTLREKKKKKLKQCVRWLGETSGLVTFAMQTARLGAMLGAPSGQRQSSADILSRVEGRDTVNESNYSGNHKDSVSLQKHQPVTYLCTSLGTTAPGLPFPVKWVPSVCAWINGGEDLTERSGQKDGALYSVRDPTSSSAERAPYLRMQRGQGVPHDAIERRRHYPSE